jgi:hypothetical protein
MVARPSIYANDIRRHGSAFARFSVRDRVEKSTSQPTSRAD